MSPAAAVDSLVRYPQLRVDPPNDLYSPTSQLHQYGPRGLRSRPFDAEGVAPQVRKIVREGNFQTARQIAQDILQMVSVQDIKGYLVERYRDLGLIQMLEMYR